MMSLASNFSGIFRVLISSEVGCLRNSIIMINLLFIIRLDLGFTFDIL